MRIAFIINDASNIGGTERVTTHFASVCAENGQQVTICSLYQSKSELFFPVHESVQLTSLMPHPVSLIKQLLSISSRLRELARQFDLIILSDSQLGLLLPFCRNAGSAKWLVWEHFNSTIETTFGSRWFGRRAAALLSDAIVVLTEQDKVSWKNKYWLKAPVFNIANPCSADIAKPRLSIKNNTVVSVGRFTEQKGFDLLVDAWALIPAGLTKGWTLRLVGPNGSAKEYVKQRIAYHKLNNVELLGETKNMTDVFDQAGIYVMSSRYEGFGLTLIEAISRGVPSIAFDCPMGPGEILGQGKYGKVVEALNVEALSKSIADFVTGQSDYQQLSEAAIQRSAAFTDKTIYQQWQQAWKKLEKGSVQQ